jgi:hypothetical protein
LSSAAAVAETWNFGGCAFRINALSCSFVAPDFLFIDLVPLFYKSCQKTDSLLKMKVQVV